MWTWYVVQVSKFGEWNEVHFSKCNTLADAKRVYKSHSEISKRLKFRIVKITGTYEVINV